MSNAPQPTRAELPNNIPAIIILPLRLFLGLIFFFAGIDKLTDPTFLDSSNANFIGKQLQNFVDYNHSPISFLLTSVAIPNARLFGIAISLTELVVGVLVALGLFTRLAAALGLLLNTSLWLTASWGATPFYTGWDLPYMFGWLTLLLAGAGPFSLDYWLASRSSMPLAVSAERRNFMIRGGATIGAIFALAAGGGVAITGLLTRSSISSGSSAALPQPTSGGVAQLGSAATPSPALAATATSSGGNIATSTTAAGGAADTPQPQVAAPSATAVSAPAPTASSSGGDINAGSVPGNGPTDTPIAAPTPIPASGVVIGKVSDVPAGNGLHFINPSTQNDAWVVHLDSGSYVAFSAICTHQGCSVNYNAAQKLFICPCHGSEYNPAQNGAVVRPPAPRPLSKLQIRVDESSGNIYYVSD